MAFCQSCGAQMSEGATVCTACGEAKSGRPYGSTPGMTPPSQYAPTATGAEVREFLSSLFDLSFTSFITTKLIKVLYVLSLLGAALIALGCDYFTTTAKCLRISRVREKMARRTATKGQDMKISPGFDQLRRANFCWARCARAERDSRSMRPRSDFNLRYCWMAVR